MRQWFDGHLDLAYLAERGRDMERIPRSRGGEGEEGDLQPGAVTFPMLAAGHVRGAFATIFVQRRVTAEEARQRDVDPLEGTWCYETADQAYGASLRQIAIYEVWDMEGHIRLLGRPDSATLPKGSRAIKTVLLLEGHQVCGRWRTFGIFMMAGCGSWRSAGWRGTSGRAEIRAAGM